MGSGCKTFVQHYQVRNGIPISNHLIHTRMLVLASGSTGGFPDGFVSPVWEFARFLHSSLPWSEGGDLQRQRTCDTRVHSHRFQFVSGRDPSWNDVILCMFVLIILHVLPSP